MVLQYNLVIFQNYLTKVFDKKLKKKLVFKKNLGVEKLFFKCLSITLCVFCSKTVVRFFYFFSIVVNWDSFKSKDVGEYF